MSDNQEWEHRVTHADIHSPEWWKLSQGFYFGKFHLKIERGGASFPLLVSLFLAALRSICSNSWLCWFTMATCTQDISSRTDVALPRLTLPSALSGFGCRTTRCEKPACRRSCLPTLTCFSTRGCKDWTLLCTQKNNQQHLGHWSCRINAGNSLLCGWQRNEETVFWFWVQMEQAPNPKEYGTCDVLLFSKWSDHNPAKYPS